MFNILYKSRRNHRKKLIHKIFVPSFLIPINSETVIYSNPSFSYVGGMYYVLFLPFLG